MRLIGYVDGVQVTFTYTPPNTWTAIIPKQLDGIYIVELHAINEAGNIANYSGMIVKIDFSNLKIEVLENDILQQEINDGFIFEELNLDILSEELDNEINTEEIEDDIEVELITSEILIEELE
jgi:hypothetical protein